MKRNQLYVLQGGESIQFGDVSATYFAHGLYFVFSWLLNGLKILLTNRMFSSLECGDEDTTDDCASNASESLLAIASPDDPINSLEEENDGKILLHHLRLVIG